MPETLRDMMKPVLSLKHLCCQGISMRFWCNQELDNFPILYNKRHWKKLGNSKLDVELQQFEPVVSKLQQFISALGVPKTLETDLFEIGLAMVPELDKIYLPLKHLNFWFHMLDSSVVSLNPTGGIKCEKTIQNILHQPQLDTNSKLYLANEFCTFDPLVSDNFEAYIDVLRGQGSHLGERCEFSRPVSHDILNQIPDMRFWELKYTWKMLSQQDKEQFSGNRDQIALSLRHKPGDPICGFLLDNLFTDKICNFWKLFSSDDPVDRFCFINQLHRFLDYLTSPFCYLDQNSINPVMALALPDDTLSYVLVFMVNWLVRCGYDHHLIFYLTEILNRSSEQFRLDFFREYEQIAHSVLNHYSSHFGELTLHILLMVKQCLRNI